MTSKPTSNPPTERKTFHRALLAGGVSLALVGALAAQAVLTPVAPVRAEAIPPIEAPSVPSFADVVERVKPAVVSIRVRGRQPVNTWTNRSDRDNWPDFRGTPFERFFREYGLPVPPRGAPDRGPSQRRTMGQGSGFFISEDGKIVTNYHVVRNAEQVTVMTDDQRELTARVVGTDERTDLALLQVEASGPFPFVTFADAPIRVGDWVVAVGNPFGLGGSVTAGIISARGRDIGAGPYDDFLQIDAPINRGNSGGPTFALNGQVVGVNTAIYSPSGGSVGIGFAIPAATVQRVVDQLEDNGRVVRGWLGVQIQQINQDIAESLGLDEAKGALVAEPQDGSPAARSGIRSGDAIVAVDGKPVEGPRELARLIADYSPGTTVSIDVVRGGRERKIEVTLGELPSSQRQAAVDVESSEPASLASLGLDVAPADEFDGGEGGLVVTSVEPNGAAAQRGIRVGDRIVEVQGRVVNTIADAEDGISAARNDGRRAVLMRVVTGERSRFVAVPITTS